MIRHSWPRVILLALPATLLAIGVACGSSAPATSKPAAPAPVATLTPKVAPSNTAVPAAAPVDTNREDMVRASVFPNARKGGVLKTAGYPDSAHFDLAQNTSVVNSNFQMMLYNGILRYNPYDAGNTIVPDLAKRWEISQDGKTWTFPLRAGVKFTDGADLTANDVVASWSRIINPPVGVSMPRKEFYTAFGAKVSAVDPLTVKFTFDSAPPLGYMLHSFALEWHGIFREKTLRENNFDLKQAGKDAPTTGAFKFKSYQVGEVWKNERNPNYWNEGLPYLDEVQVFVSQNSATRTAAFLAGQVDHTQTVAPDAFERLKDDKTVVRDYFASFSGGFLWFNMEKKPFDNRNLRRAMWLAIDPLVIQKAILDWLFTYEGGRGWTLTDTQYELPPDKVAKRLIFDRPKALAEAKKLMAEARTELALGPAPIKNVDLMVRQSDAQYEVMAQIAQLTFKNELGIEANIRIVPSAKFLEDGRKGTFDLAIGATAAPFADPSAYFAYWYKKGASENFSRYYNPQFEALLAQIDTESDFFKRYTLVQQAAQFLDSDPPSIELFYNRTLAVWKNYVKGITGKKGALVHNLSRWDTVWIDR